MQIVIRIEFPVDSVVTLMEISDSVSFSTTLYSTATCEILNHFTL